VGEEGSWQQEVRRKAKKTVRERIFLKNSSVSGVSSPVPGSPWLRAGGEKMVGERGGGEGKG
jgi:hypothetical protein